MNASIGSRTSCSYGALFGMNHSRLLLRLSSSKNSKNFGVKYRCAIARASRLDEFVEQSEKAIRLIAMHPVARVLEHFEARHTRSHRSRDVLRVRDRQNRIEFAGGNQRRAFYFSRGPQEVEGVGFVPKKIPRHPRIPNRRPP